MLTIYFNVVIEKAINVFFLEFSQVLTFVRENVRENGKDTRNDSEQNAFLMIQKKIM